MMIYKKRIYNKTTIQTAGVYPKQQGTQIYFHRRKKEWKICLFSIEKYLEIKDNKISKRKRRDHHHHPTGSTFSLSRADDHHPTNDDQRAGVKIEQRNIRVCLNFDALWLFLLARRRRRRREETILHHYGSFFLFAFAVTKNLSAPFFFRNQLPKRAMRNEIRTWTLVALRPATDAICWVAANIMCL